MQPKHQHVKSEKYEHKKRGAKQHAFGIGCRPVNFFCSHGRLLVQKYPKTILTVPGPFSFNCPALPRRRQQPNRFQFFIRLLEERNALLALVVLHVVRKAVDVGVPELLARH